jgi:hypothetical protein
VKNVDVLFTDQIQDLEKCKWIELRDPQVDHFYIFFSEVIGRLPGTPEGTQVRVELIAVDLLEDPAAVPHGAVDVGTVVIEFVDEHQDIDPVHATPPANFPFLRCRTAIPRARSARTVWSFLLPFPGRRKT